MLIIINDDPAYLSWISRHRQGFVVDCKRKPTRNHLVLHRATCSIVKPHKRARLTTGAHIKACSMDVAELTFWAEEQTGSGLTACEDCQPDHPDSAIDEHQAKHALTRLGRDVLSFVLDVAVVYLDDQAPGFHPKMHDIAEYLGKTPAQVMPAIQRLIDEGYLFCDRRIAGNAPLNAAIIYPTSKAIRSIPAFGAMPEEAIVAELDKLRIGQ